MYFITTLQIQNKLDNLVLGDKRCIGYFETFDEAENIVLNNIGDIEETIYNYCVIENIPAGLYQYDQNAKWYKFNNVEEVYEPCEKPKELKHYVGFGIG